MNRKTLLISLGAGAALVALLAWAFAPRPVEVEVAEATVGRFEATVDEDARTRLRERYIVSAPLAARLQRIALREGDAVTPDTVLATLQPVLSPLLDDRTLREQQARMGAAEAGVLQARARIGAASVALERAKLEQGRSAALAQQGFIAPTKLDGDRLAVQSAERDLQSAREGEHVAGHELAVAREALGAVRGGAGRGAPFVLRAPIGGRVLKVHVTSEATVALGTPLIELGDTAALEIVAELLTNDALQAAPGSLVRIERWGGPAVLQGRVRRVEPGAFTKVSALGVEEQRVNVLIDLTSPPADWAALGDGYRVGVRIVTRSEDGVLRVPVSAVFPLPAGSGQAEGTAPGMAVFVVDGGKARLQPVTLGARNGSLAWVKDGIAKGTQVIVYPPTTVKDGARIKARKV